MPGKNYIKVTSILLVIGAVISVILYPIQGLLLSYATIDTQESMGWIIVAVCIFYTILAVLQLIASVKGIKGCNDKSAASNLKTWGMILLVISFICGVVNCVQAFMSGESVLSSALSILLSLILPILYIYGASLNEKA